MSLYSKYLALKKKDANTIYLFKSGIFFLALQDDATLISKELNLKTTSFGKDVIKCGFPISRGEHYFRILEAKNLPFSIIDDIYFVENYNDYINNTELKQIVDKIIGIDFDTITFKEAYQILLDTSNSLKEIYK